MLTLGELPPEMHEAALRLLFREQAPEFLDGIVRDAIRQIRSADAQAHALLGVQGDSGVLGVLWATRGGAGTYLVGDPAVAPQAESEAHRIVSILAQTLSSWGLNHQTRLLQVMLGPQGLRFESEFVAAGWERATSLEYLAAQVEPTAERQRSSLHQSHDLSPINLHKDQLHWVGADTLSESQLETLLAATHLNSQDCSFLEGKRSPAELLACYRESSESGESLWEVLLIDGVPAACLLAGLQGEGTQIEWLYLGVADQWRGRGLGHAAVEHGFDGARNREVSMVVLGLDQSNDAARHLYSRWGFRVWDRRVVLLKWDTD